MPLFPTLVGNRSTWPARTAEGVRGIRFPTTGWTERILGIESCQGCSKWEGDHDCAYGLSVSVPFGSHSQDTIDDEQTFTAEELVEWFTAFQILHYTLYGMIDDIQFGAGANNASQRRDYRLLSVDGNRIRVRGRHPYYQVWDRRSYREDWPATPGRIQSTLEDAALMPGSMVYFEEPSVMHGKKRPFVVRVEEIVDEEDLEATEFWLRLSSDVSAAMEPYDERYPPSLEDGYRVRIYSYVLLPAGTPNWQGTVETQWTGRRIVVTAAELAASDGIVTLTNSDDDDTRIIWPDMVGLFLPSPALTVKVKGVGLPTFIEGEALLDGRLTMSGTGPWETTIDLSEFLGDPDLVEITITYYAEAVASDEFRVPWFGTCGNDQIDYSGSYIHEEVDTFPPGAEDPVPEGRVCRNINCPVFQAGEYSPRKCWRPDVEGFGLGNETTKYKTLTMPAGDFRKQEHLEKLWNSGSWMVQWPAPGSSATIGFSMQRVGPGSLGEICGGFLRYLPTGVFPRRDRWYPPQMGIRMTGTDGEGNAGQWIEYGLHVRETPQNAANEYASGGVATTLVTGWNSKDDDLGNTVTGWVSDYPAARVGGTFVYTGINMPNNDKNRCIKSNKGTAGVQLFGTGMLIGAAERSALTNEVRSWMA